MPWNFLEKNRIGRLKMEIHQQGQWLKTIALITGLTIDEINNLK